MYSRSEQSFNAKRCFGQAPNGSVERFVKRELPTAGENIAQEVNYTGMDFSIFHGQNKSAERQPLNIQNTRDFQDRSFQQANTYQKPNQGASLMPQNGFQKQSHAQHNKMQLQRPLNINNSSYSRSEPPQGAYGNANSRASTSASTDNFQRQHGQLNMHNFENNYSNFKGSTNSSSNALGVMAPPKPLYSSNTQKNASSTSQKEEMSSSGQSRIKKYGESDSEKMCIFTGTVERVIKWGKIFQNHFCYFEVIAAVVSIADGKVQFERTMLLRDKKGPILQVIYYFNSTHINIEDFHLGQMLRVVGRMIGQNIMSAITIRGATVKEVDILPRMCYVSDNAVSNLCG